MATCPAAAARQEEGGSFSHCRQLCWKVLVLSKGWAVPHLSPVDLTSDGGSGEHPFLWDKGAV